MTLKMVSNLSECIVYRMFSEARQFVELWYPEPESVTFGGTFLTKNSTVAKKGWILDNGATPDKKVDLSGGVGGFGVWSVIQAKDRADADAGIENWADTTLMDNIRRDGLETMPATQHWTS
mmetsp:Transcript_71598/g.191104  ORF Transcript_71598/g.191104 Transcript_71598/m.191104 type:complete len:121 (-) Transcript_71598:181-543(-)